MSAISVSGIFFDLPRADLEALRDSALASLKAGQVVVNWSVAGNSFQKAFPGMSPAEVLAEAQAALRRLDGTRVRTTYARFGPGGAQ